jgi:Zn-dependent protease
MRDPLTWSFPLPRLFGVNIRVHVFFLLVVVGLPMREAFVKDALPGLWIEACVLMGLLFGSVLLHEFGHCFGARAVDGDATEVLLWPLGGLASTEVPHTPRAHFITTAAGPAVNLLLCVGVCLALAAVSIVPSFKPWADPYFPIVYNWSDGYHYGSKSGRSDLLRFTGYKQGETWVSEELVKPATDSSGKEIPGRLIETKNNKEVTAVKLSPDEVVPVLGDNGKPLADRFGVPPDKEKKEKPVPVRAEPLQYAGAIVFASRLFWVNWFLLLVNLVPAFPLDGGRLLQSFLWWRSDYRQATLFAIGIGFVMMLLCALLGIIVSEPLILGLALFVYIACRRQYIVLETGGEEALFGYDFSEGYTSLERDQPPQPPRRRQSWLQRWFQKRAERKMRREQETREAEERRMDELLEKVQRVGLPGLTDEERRFLTRVSARYRNRQE